MTDILHVLITNPIAVGAIINIVLKFINDFVTGLDKSGTLTQFTPQLHTVYLVLAFLASAFEMASQGKLENVDWNAALQFILYWIQVIAGGKAMEPVVTPKKKV